MKFVAYYRVSTTKQGKSGLGLDAQTYAVETYSNQSRGTIIATFTEIETGKNNQRPELLKALELCRRKKAVLVIAKLDRLSRNLAFIANLIESKVEFVACDNPHANKAMLQMMAVFAELERDSISTRTKDALKAAKARGQVLGRRDADVQAMADRRKEQTAKFRADIFPTVKQMKDSGLNYTQIATNLNRMQVRTCNNRSWYPMTVKRLLHIQKEKPS